MYSSFHYRAQGKTYKFIGINLTNEFFCHGQLYVGLSRCGSAKNVKVFKPKDCNTRGYMKNVVYPEILSSEELPTPPEASDFDPAESKPPTKSILSYAEAKAMTNQRLAEIGMQLCKPTPENGNCLIEAIFSYME